MKLTDEIFYHCFESQADSPDWVFVEPPGAAETVYKKDTWILY